MASPKPLIASLLVFWGVFLVASGALADDPLSERYTIDLEGDYFMTGVPLAVDGNGNTRVDVSNQPASFSVTTADVPSSATLVKGWLYWGGTQSQPGPACDNYPDDTVSLTDPDGTVHSLTAAECVCSDGGASSYDVWACVADITADLQVSGTALQGNWTVDGYVGQWNDGSTDNASASLLLFYEDPALRPRRLVVYDGIEVMSNNSRLISLSGFTVDTTPGGRLTYYTMEGDVGGSGTEGVTVDGMPGGAGPLVLEDLPDNPGSNLMNRTINTTIPPQSDVIGVDIDQFDITSALSAGDTAMDVDYQAGNDKWWLVVNVVGIDLYDPKLNENSSKSWSHENDADGDGAVTPGDTVRYTIRLENTGNEAATVDVIDLIPSEAASWTLIVDGGGSNNSTAMQLNLGDVTVNAGSSVDIVFDVVIASVSDGTLMSNTASWTEPLQGGSAGDVTAPDVTIRRDLDGDSFYDLDDCGPSNPNVYPGHPEICDGFNNDCNAGTGDGSDESWLGMACDGPDSDLCTEGLESCVGGTRVCTDGTPDNLELCDGMDNDCNVATSDGADEAWLNAACDGADTDLCAEGSSQCSGGMQVCTDNTGNNQDICDGNDNDCNPATADGAAESWFEQSCDGPDSDLCMEGLDLCSAGVRICSDNTGDRLDLCDGADNDCNPATTDGEDEPWFGAGCDGPDSDLCQEGIETCTTGSRVCTDNTTNDLDLCDGADNDCNSMTADGADEPWLGMACDGADTDLCDEGTRQCVGGIDTCTDNSGNTLEICDGLDNDCDTDFDEGCNCVHNAVQSCYSGPPNTAGVGLCRSGTQTCNFGIWGPCQNEVVPTAEVCDGQDNNCDNVDDNFTRACYTGPAGTLGVGLCTSGTELCTNGSWGSCSGEVTPTPDLCDGLDNDCNPATGDGAAETWYGQSCDGADSDLCEEGAWSCSSSVKTCLDSGDDDLDVCDGLDNDCNPATADGSGEAWYGNPCDGADADFCLEGQSTCTSGSRACDDTTGDIPDLCDGLDNDCTMLTADGSDESWYGTSCDGMDSDLCEEGNWTCNMGAQACTDLTGDTVEVCDGVDNNCNGPIDEGVTTNWFADMDMDGFGDPMDTVAACSPPDGYLADGQDCDDTRSQVYPGAIELCDGLDNDCDTVVPPDELDQDMDGMRTCEGDCDDTMADVYDGAEEICDGLDNNCDGALLKSETSEVFGVLTCVYSEDPDGDADGDGLTNRTELRLKTDPGNPDTDGDGLTDDVETNGGQGIDTDEDFVIDALDEDDDGDGISTEKEIADSAELGDDDPDGDGDVSWLDFDADGDGLSDNFEALEMPMDPPDTDGDGTPDYLDADSDDDGVLDEVDNCRLVFNPEQLDGDDDGVGDACLGEVCDNGIDDNDDGNVDCDDPLCQSADACGEVCDNGEDDDEDGLVDCEDADCADAMCAEICTNGLDDDGDGRIDCSDLDCATDDECRPDQGEAEDVSRLEFEGDPSEKGADSCGCRVRTERSSRIPWLMAALGLMLWVRIRKR